MQRKALLAALTRLPDSIAFLHRAFAAPALENDAYRKATDNFRPNGHALRSRQSKYKLQAAFQDAARSNRAAAAVSLLSQYRLAGGQRLRQPERALALLPQMKREGVRADGLTYGALIIALTKAHTPPYMLPAKTEAQARALYAQMLAEGCTPRGDAGQYVLNALLAAQAQAGLVDAAFATFEEFGRWGVPPSTNTVGILLNAAARARQPGLAHETLDRLRRLPGVEVTTPMLNSLLNAHGRANDVDGAYAVWLEMQRMRVLPDQVTQLALARAFEGNATLGAEVVREAVELRASILASDSAQAKRTRSRAAQSDTYDRHRAAALDGTAQDRHYLDLHGLSASAARMAVVQMLETLVKAEERADEGRGLIIVVGRGLHTPLGQLADLKGVVKGVLDQADMPHYCSRANPGQVRVDSRQLGAFLQRRRSQQTHDTYMHRTALQYVLMGLGASGLAATFLIPRILEHA